MKELAFGASDALSDALIKTGILGLHPLFDARSIRRAFSRINRGLISEDHLLLAHRALRELSQQTDLISMMVFVKSLPESVHDMLVYLYFRALERRIIEAGPTLH